MPLGEVDQNLYAGIWRQPRQVRVRQAWEKKVEA